MVIFQVMRVIIFDQMGNVLNKFGCSKHLEFPNGVVVNDRQEIFISDNRAHCVKVFDYEGNFLRQIGGEGKWLSKATTLQNPTQALLTVARVLNLRIKSLRYGGGREIKNNFLEASC